MDVHHCGYYYLLFVSTMASLWVLSFFVCVHDGFDDKDNFILFDDIVALLSMSAMTIYFTTYILTQKFNKLSKKVTLE